MKQKILRIVATVLLLAAAIVVEHTCTLPTWQLLLIYIVPYLLIGYDVLREAAEGIAEGEVFDEDFLMCVATVGALVIGFLPGASNEFAEAVAVMLFFQVGELFEDYAEGRSRRAISHLMEIRPDTATVIREGEERIVNPADIRVGEEIVVRPGEKIALDGRIVEGDSSLNTVALTGESMPRSVHEGDMVASGCINVSGVLKIKVEKTFENSTASRIIALVEEAGERKSRSETFIARFARVYTPIVVGVAVVLAVVPPLVSGAFADTFPTWLERALTFLVVSCPCALVISVPLTFFCGIGGASRRGILVKGSTYIDALAKLDTVVFDKTGTLTHGRFEVNALHPDDCDAQHLLHLAAHVERYSTHPIALSLKAAYPNEQDGCRVEQVEEVAGQGVRAVVEGHTVCVGNAAMMDAVGAKWHPCHKVGTIVHVAIDGRYAGHIVVSDTVKADAAEAIASLKRLGIHRTVMLTGDRREVAESVAAELGLDACYAELLPADKVAHLEEELETASRGGGLLAAEQATSKQRANKSTVAFIGDGINDAPVLALADVGVAMGGLGSDAAIESADVVLMDDAPSRLATAVQIARHTLAIARENVVFAIGIKLLVLALAAVGLATMWMAVFADVGVTVLAVLNAMRAANSKV